jgi:hypothetical protein
MPVVGAAGAGAGAGAVVAGWVVEGVAAELCAQAGPVATPVITKRAIAARFTLDIILARVILASRCATSMPEAPA